MELTFRSGELKRDNGPQVALADLSEGQKIDGRIKKVEDYGLFIEIEGSKLSGLCHKSEVSYRLSQSDVPLIVIAAVR